MKHFVFWAPEADERLQSLVRGDDSDGRVVRAVREIDFWLARGLSTLASPGTTRCEWDSWRRSPYSLTCSPTRRR